MNPLKYSCILFFIVINLAQAQSYQDLNTSELEKEVEERTVLGTLPFEMGLELIKRWIKESSS